MNRLKRWLALFLAMVMCVSAVPASAAVEETEQAGAEKEITFNTGNYEHRMIQKQKLDALLKDFSDKYGENYEGNAQAEAEAADLRHYVAYQPDGSYEIRVEENAFFPYEVQFTLGRDKFSQWFMENGDSVTVGGHEFRLKSDADGKVVTKMSLEAGGDTVRVYPERKFFTNDEDSLSQGASLLPLEERMFWMDVQDYTMVELSRIKIKFADVFAGETRLPGDTLISWKGWPVSDIEDYRKESLHDFLGSLYDAGGFEFIIGEQDQLAADNIRYIVKAEQDYYKIKEWLCSSVRTGDDAGSGIESACSYIDWGGQGMATIKLKEKVEKDGQYFITLGLNPEHFVSEKIKYTEMKVFEGKCTEDSLGTEITDSIWGNGMDIPGSGYLITMKNNAARQWITFVSYKNGKVTGCLPVELEVVAYSSDTVYINGLWEENGARLVGYEGEYVRLEDEDREYVFHLYRDYPLDGQYKLKFNFYKDDAGREYWAYRGRFDSIRAAQEAGAEDVKEALLGDGYLADYSGEGISFSMFIGTDDDAGQKTLHYLVKTDRNVSDDTGVRFQKIRTEDGTEIPSCWIPERLGYQEHDSYDGNIYTVFIDGKAGEPAQEVDLSKLVLEYSLDEGAKMYVGDKREGSERTSPIDFTKKAVQFTVASEDGKKQENYFIRIFKTGTEAEAVTHPAELYITSLDQEKSHTKRGDIIESERELFLDSRHYNLHDILVANVGYTTMSALRAELKSDSIVMDDYWRLSGSHDLAGFTTTERDKSIGLLPNLAKVRLKAKEGAEPKDKGDLGTLTFTAQEESGQKTKMVLRLTGVVGDPRITMTEIKNPTKYVPYGILITNNNTYEWNQPEYSLIKGRLPEGMVLQPNGELYGVPTEAGKFEVTIQMNNVNNETQMRTDTRTFQFEVLDNSDDNVANAEDPGYELEKKIKDIYDTTPSGDYLIISKGVFDEYTDLYIDGKKLTLDEDYKAEKGSTRLTIIGKALPKSEGVHTLGVEFRKDKNQRIVKAAAQNYTVEKKQEPDPPRPEYSGGGGSSGPVVMPGPPLPKSDPKPVTPPKPEPDPDLPSPKPAPKPVPKQRKDLAYAGKYTVRAGDTLKTIAKKFYGRSSKWKKIYDANSKLIPASKKLKKGMKLIIPALNYTVKEGDDIKSIAKKYFGANSKWKRVYNVNQDVIPTDRQLKTGMKLILTVPVVCTVHTVRKGDNLGKISQKYYGKSSKWKKVFQANKGSIYSSYRMKVGSQLHIPAMTCTAKKGDSLKALSKKYYGTDSKWRQIYDANTDVIPKSKKIKKGVTLVVPVPVDLS